MNTRHLLSTPAILLLSLSVLAATRRCDASVVFQYVAVAPFASAGTTIPLYVYLQEDLTNGSRSVIAANDGIVGVGVAITRIVGDKVSITGVTPDLIDFAGPSGQGFTASAASFVENLDPNATHGIRAGNGPPGGPLLTNAVYLGQFALTIGPNGPIYTAFSIGPKGATGGNTLDNAGDDLDISGTAGNGEAYIGVADPSVEPFTLVFGPEPTSLGLLALAAPGLLVRKRVASGPNTPITPLVRV